MPLKGLAIGPLWRLRPPADERFRSPRADEIGGEAARILVDAGWHSEFEDFLATPGCWSTRSAANFSADDDELDLHWHLLTQGSWPGVDDPYWRHAQPVVIGGVAAMTLSDTDHLFHTCVHGARPNCVSPIRWVADAAKILAVGKIDWDRMLGQAETLGLVIPLRHTLPYLSFCVPPAHPRRRRRRCREAPATTARPYRGPPPEHGAADGCLDAVLPLLPLPSELRRPPLGRGFQPLPPDRLRQERRARYHAMVLRPLREGLAEGPGAGGPDQGRVEAGRRPAVDAGGGLGNVRPGNHHHPRFRRSRNRHAREAQGILRRPGDADERRRVDRLRGLPDASPVAPREGHRGDPHHGSRRARCPC